MKEFSLQKNWWYLGLPYFAQLQWFSLYGFQFPDDLLKDSTRVVTALRKRLQSLREFDVTGSGDETDIRLFVMADTAYGSCCVDEVGASHNNADCVIHYGHTCFSPWVTDFFNFEFGHVYSFSHILLSSVRCTWYNHNHLFMIPPSHLCC